MSAAAFCAVVGLSTHAFAAENGTVTFVVRDDRGNDVDAKITIDDDATPVPLGRSKSIEPGIHDIHWSVASGQRGVQKLTVIEGQQGRIFQIIANVPPPALAAPPAAPTALPPTAPAASERRGPGPLPYVLLAGGATLAVTSAVFQLVALREDSDARHYFWTSTRDDLGADTRAAIAEAGRSRYDAAQTNETIAITCGILAVTAVSIAVTWLILGHR